MKVFVTTEVKKVTLELAPEDVTILLKIISLAEKGAVSETRYYNPRELLYEKELGWAYTVRNLLRKGTGPQEVKE